MSLADNITNTLSLSSLTELCKKICILFNIEKRHSASHFDIDIVTQMSCKSKFSPYLLYTGITNFQGFYIFIL